MSSGPLKSMFRLVQKQSVLLTLRQRILLFVAGVGIIITFIIGFNTTNSKKAQAATESLTTGSFIINMGVTPQTYSNGLKPYGMLYDLIVNYSVPVKWVIEPSKVKDGTDFTYNAVNYKGGPFIIPAEYINTTISNRISFWQTKGVQGVYTTSSISVPVYATLTAFPIAIIDNQSGNEDIVEQYYTNAGIPSTGYVFGTPSILQDCNDIWVNPHGNPTWASHSYLYNYVTVSKNFIWAQCHAVSVMEGVKNTVSPFEQLNYLTTNGLKCYNSGNCGPPITESHAGNPTSPFTHYYPSDPMMQFMGTMDGATNSGSEKWYQPQAASSGQWRATTKRLVTTSNGTSPNEGVLMAYGPAYGNVNNGYVMYEAGHDLDGSGTTAEKTAAQRAYFNFVLFAGIKKQLVFSGYTIPNSYKSNETKSVSATILSGTAPYTYVWSSTIGGTFTNGGSASASFTAPNTPVALTGAIKCTVTDACGRQNFVSQIVNVSENTLPVTLKEFNAKLVNGSVLISWITASEINNAFFTIERSQNGYDFTEVGKVEGSGNSTHEVSYSLTDNNPVEGQSYYRLTQTDFDDNYKRYPPIGVYFNNSVNLGNTIIAMSPVPFDNYIKINFNVILEGNVNFTLISDKGSVLKNENVKSSAGFNSYTIDNLGLLPGGVYFILMRTSDNELQTRKLIKL